MPYPNIFLAHVLFLLLLIHQLSIQKILSEDRNIGTVNGFIHTQNVPLRPYHGNLLCGEKWREKIELRWLLSRCFIGVARPNIKPIICI